MNWYSVLIDGILLIIVALQPVKQIQIMDNDMYDDDDEPGEDSEPEK